MTEAIKDPRTSNAIAYFVDECDVMFEKAVAFGAKPITPPADTPWGARWARVEDGWGNRWTFTTRPARRPDT